MLKFFRKIRQQLLSENKFTKYLIYAVGEIMLVVIGILIALQINNWNEDRITHERQLEYLRMIKDEMSQNVIALNTEIDRVNISTDYVRILIKQFTQPKESIPEDSLRVVLNVAFAAEFHFKNNNAVLSEIIAQGGLREIENESIRISLASWEAKISDIRLQEKDVYDFREMISIRWLEAGNAFQQYPSVSDFKGIGNNWDLLEDQKFTNITPLFLLTSRTLLVAYYNPILEDTEELIALIDEELATNN